MTSFALSRSPALDHHVTQGRAWLADSAEGANTAALSYAAFEFRLAIERLGVHYWLELLARPLEEKDLREMRSFRRIENRIYELGGHQKEINGHFEFMRTVLHLLKIERTLPTPNLTKLSSYWHKCSELCHIGGSLSSNDPQLMRAIFSDLEQIESALVEQVSGLVGWPAIADDGFRQLRTDFTAARANAADIERYLQKTGAWARVQYQDDRAAEFIGKAIPPKDTNDPSAA